MRTFFILLASMVAFSSCQNGYDATKKAPVQEKTDLEKLLEVQLSENILREALQQGTSELSGTQWISGDRKLVFDDKQLLCSFSFYTNVPASYSIINETISFDVSITANCFKKADKYYLLREKYDYLPKQIAEFKKELQKPNTSFVMAVQYKVAIDYYEQHGNYYNSFADLATESRETLKRMRLLCEEKLQDTSLTTEDRESITRFLNILKEKENEIKQNPNMFEEIFIDAAKQLNAAGAALESINPMTATLAADKKSFTVKKMLVGVGNDYKPEFADDVVFTKQE